MPSFIALYAGEMQNDGIHKLRLVRSDRPLFHVGRGVKDARQFRTGGKLLPNFSVIRRDGEQIGNPLCFSSLPKCGCREEKAAAADGVQQIHPIVG